jgi:hypothetical protein
MDGQFAFFHLDVRLAREGKEHAARSLGIDVAHGCSLADAHAAFRSGLFPCQLITI